MGILIRKERGLYALTGIARLSIVAFFVALSLAYVNTIWAVYLDSFVHSISKVGLISSVLTIFSFIFFFVFIPVIEKKNKIKLYSLTLFLSAILYFLFALNKNLYVLLILALILTVITTLRITSFGIIIKDKSSKKQLPRNEGLVYTFNNIAWVIGPLIAGIIAASFGMNYVFFLSAIFIFLAFFLFQISRVKDSNIKKKSDESPIKNFFEFFKERERTLAYILRGGVGFWWILIYLFMPLYMIRQGLSSQWVGYFLFAVAVPLIFLEYKFSKISEKKGFKKMFKIGYLIPAVLVLISFFLSNIYVILLLLVLASVGLAMLEPTTEAHFFSVLKGKQDLRFYGPYNTTIDVSQFAAKILPSIFLVFLPFKFVFLFFSLFMFIMFLISYKIKDMKYRIKKFKNL